MRRSEPILLPPHVLDARFARPEQEPEEPARDDGFNYERDVVPYLSRLRPTDADIVELYFAREVSQRRIGLIFGLTQPAVCYRLRTALARIRLLSSLPTVTDEQARADLRGVLSRDEVRVFCAVVRTYSQTRAAAELGIACRRVSERWARIRSAIEAASGARLDMYRSLVAAMPRRKKNK